MRYKYLYYYLNPNMYNDDGSILKINLKVIIFKMYLKTKYLQYCLFMSKMETNKGKNTKYFKHLQYDFYIID